MPSSVSFRSLPGPGDRPVSSAVRGDGRRERLHADTATCLSREPTTHRLIAGWTVAYALGSWVLEFGYSRLGIDRPPPGPLVVKCVVYAVLWAPILFAAVYLSDRWPVRSERDLSRLLLHLVATVAATFAWTTLAYHLCRWLVDGWRPLGVGRMYVTTGYSVLYVFSTVVLITHVLHDIRRRQARDVAALAASEGAAKARLQLLAMELQPHFMCNALQSVSALLRIDADRATQALRNVRALLAHAMTVETRAEVPLSEEIDSLRWYTNVQELRYGRRLRFRWSVDRALQDAAVPALLLQPIVENAVKFSVEATTRAGEITIAAERRGRHLVLEVTDDGVGIGGRGRKGAGLGLTNARERLRQLYGDEQSLTLAPNLGRPGTMAEVRIPYRRIGTASTVGQPAV